MPLLAADRELIADLQERLGPDTAPSILAVFGPRLRGDSEADLDLCLVFPSLDQPLRERIDHLAWAVGFDHGVTVCPLLVTSAEWDGGATPLLARIRQEGEIPGG